ncbi:hypothetical protein Rsub_09473 [Raphidocelis subcapitata]|uniref:SMP-LTD domain-containing protein n=1 Tax=Raphidocelis subcapitata TaxID=307507 RepID=A0A2V0PA53_9CHLO|nr:hypothetical protein Rsub_09473 [Raphidocelis subcapitata]|eukprot:GBF96731.1 hypothetical protein Rsub_09473 [Raphidocelis subcapitata]
MERLAAGGTVPLTALYDELAALAVCAAAVVWTVPHLQLWLLPSLPLGAATLLLIGGALGAAALAALLAATFFMLTEPARAPTAAIRAANIEGTSPDPAGLQRQPDRPPHRGSAAAGTASFGPLLRTRERFSGRVWTWSARLRGGVLRLASDGAGSSADGPGRQPPARARVQLAGCRVRAVDARLAVRGPWGTAAPLEVAGGDGQRLLQGCGAFLLFAQDGAVQEQWLAALLRASGSAGGAVARLDADYSAFCERSRQQLLSAGGAGAAGGDTGSGGGSPDLLRLSRRTLLRGRSTRTGARAVVAVSTTMRMYAIPPCGSDATDQLEGTGAVSAARVPATATPRPTVVDAPQQPGRTSGEQLQPPAASAAAAPSARRAPSLRVSPVAAGASRRAIKWVETPPLSSGSSSPRGTAASAAAAGGPSAHASPPSPERQHPKAAAAASAAPLAGANALLCRVAFELLRSPEFEALAGSALQACLSKFRRPDYLHSLKLTSLDLGSAPPVITGLRAAACPRGRGGGGGGGGTGREAGGAAPQLQAQVSYSGRAVAVVETRVELQLAPGFQSFRRRLQGVAAEAAASPRSASPAAAARRQPQLQPAGRRQPPHLPALLPGHARFDAQLGGGSPGLDRPPSGFANRPNGGAGGADDAADSAMHEAVASTLREEQRDGASSAAAAAAAAAGGARRKLLGVLPLRAGGRAAADAALRAVDAFAGGLEQIRLELTITLSRLDGGLLLWLPPPPSDRLWVSFLSPPRVELTVQPSLAGRALRHAPLAHRVSAWLEAQLLRGLASGMRFPAAVDLRLPIFQRAEGLCAPPAAAAGRGGGAAGGAASADGLAPAYSGERSSETSSSGDGEDDSSGGECAEAYAAAEGSPPAAGASPKREPKQSIAGPAAPGPPARDSLLLGRGDAAGAWAAPPIGWGPAGRTQGFRQAPDGAGLVGHTALAAQQVVSAPPSTQASPAASRHRLAIAEALASEAAARLEALRRAEAGGSSGGEWWRGGGGDGGAESLPQAAPAAVAPQAGAGSRPHHPHHKRHWWGGAKKKRSAKRLLQGDDSLWSRSLDSFEAAWQRANPHQQSGADAGGAGAADAGEPPAAWAARAGGGDGRGMLPEGSAASSPALGGGGASGGAVWRSATGISAAARGGALSDWHAGSLASDSDAGSVLRRAGSERAVGQQRPAAAAPAAGGAPLQTGAAGAAGAAPKSLGGPASVSSAGSLAPVSATAAAAASSARPAASGSGGAGRLVPLLLGRSRSGAKPPKSPAPPPAAAADPARRESRGGPAQQAPSVCSAEGSTHSSLRSSMPAACGQEGSAAGSAGIATVPMAATPKVAKGFKAKVEGLFRTGSLGAGSAGRGDDSGSGLSALFKSGGHKHRARAAPAAAAAAGAAAQPPTASSLQHARSTGPAAGPQHLIAEWLSASETAAAAGAAATNSRAAAGRRGHARAATWGGADDAGAGAAAAWEAQQAAEAAEGVAPRSAEGFGELAFGAERFVSCIDCGGGGEAARAGLEAPPPSAGAARVSRASDGALLRRRQARLLDDGGDGGAAAAGGGPQPGALFEVPPIIVSSGGDGDASVSVPSPSVPSLCTWHNAPSGAGGAAAAAASSPPGGSGPGSGGASGRHHSRRSSAGSGGSVTLGGPRGGATVESATPRVAVWPQAGTGWRPVGERPAAG